MPTRSRENHRLAGPSEGPEPMLAAFVQAPIGKAVVSLDGAFLEVNRALCELLGYSEDELLARDFQSLTHPEDLETSLEWLERMRSGACESIRFEKRYFRCDGGVLHALTSSSLVRGPDGKGCFLVSQIQDLRELHDMHRELELANEQLRRSNEELERFAYAASHDLQEPLRTIASYVGLLKNRYEDRLDADGREFMAFIAEGASRMKTMIEALLDYSRAGRIDLQKEPVDLARIVEGVRHELATGLEDAGADLVVGPLPTVAGDPTLLAQLFGNLIGNSLKFRSAAAPVVEITSERGETGWRIFVKDNGNGIDPRYRARVFEVFKRLDRRQPGSGIGLSICKQVVERHGGDIELRSELGRGAEFVIRLPFE